MTSQCFPVGFPWGSKGLLWMPMVFMVVKDFPTLSCVLCFFTSFARCVLSFLKLCMAVILFCIAVHLLLFQEFCCGVVMFSLGCAVVYPWWSVLSNVFLHVSSASFCLLESFLMLYALRLPTSPLRIEISTQRSTEKFGQATLGFHTHV